MKKGKGKKKSERQIKIDWQQKKSPNFGLCGWVKNKKLFNYVLLVGKYVFYVAKLTLSHPYAN